jgi:hypothetical protein
VRLSVLLNMNKLPSTRLKQPPRNAAMGCRERESGDGKLAVAGGKRSSRARVCVCACLSSCHTPDDARSSTSLDRRSRSRNSKTPREIPSPALACPIGGMARHSRVQQPGSVDCEPPGHDARHYRRVLTLLCSTVTNM